MSELALKSWVQLPFPDGPDWVQVQGLLRPAASGDKINSGDDKWRIYAVRDKRRLEIRVAGGHTLPVCQARPSRHD